MWVILGFVLGVVLTIVVIAIALIGAIASGDYGGPPPSRWYPR